MDVGQTELAKLGEHPLRVLCVGLAPDDAAPELRVAMVAIPAGHGSQVVYILDEMFAVNERVGLVGGREAPADLRIALVDWRRLAGLLSEEDGCGGGGE